MYTRIVLSILFILSLCFVLNAQDDNPPNIEPCLENEVTIKVTYVDEGVKDNEFPSVDPPANPPEDDTGNRYVYFAHGHTGNETSWATAQAHVLARSINNNNPDDWVDIDFAYNLTYPSLIGVDNGWGTWAQQLKSPSECEDDGVDITRNIVVAHSFGGYIGKKTYGQAVLSNTPSDELPYGGMITFDSPHAGAPFANNIGDLGDFISTGCNDLLAGPAIELIDSLPIIELFIPGVLSSVQDITDSLCLGTGTIITRCTVKN